MKRCTAITMAACALILCLSARVSTSETEMITDTTTEPVEPKTVHINPTDAPAKELPDEDGSILDFTCTKSIGHTLSPFNFRILGDVIRNPYDDGTPLIHVDRIHVSENNGGFIQEISVNAWPRDTLESDLYGLEFGDYNADGYLDLSIRRFPGESTHDRTHYVWLWDSQTAQFAYDWKRSEAVTNENAIGFTVTQNIHDELPPFTIRLLGRRIEGWSSDIQDKVDHLDANIHILRVLNSDGEIMQEFDRLNAIPPRYAPSYGLHFADYNFDGYLDMALYLSEGGTSQNEPHLYWLWDPNAQQFAGNEQLNEISLSSGISINAEKKRLETFTRFSISAGATGYYEYIDGIYVLVYFNRYEYRMVDGTDDRLLRYEIVKELIDGEMVVTEGFCDDEAQATIES